MVVKTILFGKIEIPDTKEEVLSELGKCRTHFCNYPNRYTQAKN